MSQSHCDHGRAAPDPQHTGATLATVLIMLPLLCSTAQFMTAVVGV